MNWKDFKSDSQIIRVDFIDSTALSVLFENCLRMGNESNNNVMIATVNPEAWMSDISNTILNNVTYICKFPSFQTKTYSNDELIVTNYHTESKEFQSLDDLKSFIVERGRVSLLVIYIIIQYIDLRTINQTWLLRFAEIVDKKILRDKKIEYLTNE